MLLRGNALPGEIPCRVWSACVDLPSVLVVLQVVVEESDGQRSTSEERRVAVFDSAVTPSVHCNDLLIRLPRLRAGEAHLRLL